MNLLYIMFSLYGLMIWCPEYLKLLRAREYETHTEIFLREEHNGTTFTGSWENRQYKDCTFFNCKYVISRYISEIRARISIFLCKYFYI